MKRSVLIVFLLFICNGLLSENYIDKANDFYRSKEYDKALNLYDIILDSGKVDSEIKAYVIFKKAKCYTYLNETEEAIETFKEYLSYDKTKKYYPNTIYILSLLYLKQNKVNKFKELKSYLFKTFPDSKYTNFEYWKNLLPENSRELSYSSEDQKMETRNVQPEIKYDLVKSNIEYVMLDFEKASVKKIIEAISSITNVKYELDFLNIVDYATIKSEEKLSANFLPILLNKILVDYDYDLKKFNNDFKVTKTVSEINNYVAKHKIYYILSYTDPNKYFHQKQNIIRFPSKKIVSNNFDFFKYILLSGDSLEDIFSFLKQTKIASEELSRYKTKNYKILNSTSKILFNQLNNIQLKGLEYVKKLFENIQFNVNSPKIERLRNFLFNEKNLEIIKNLKGIEYTKNTIQLVFPKNFESFFDSLINFLDINLFLGSSSNVHTYKLKFASAENVALQIKNLFSDEVGVKFLDNNGFKQKYIQSKLLKQITFDKRTNSIMIIAESNLASRIESLILMLDVKVDGVIPSIRIYKLKNSDSEKIKKQLELLLSNPVFNVYNIISVSRTNSIIVMAKNSAFKLIDEIIFNIDSEQKVDKKIIYPYIIELSNRAPAYISKYLKEIINSGIYSENFIKLIPIENQNKLVVLIDSKDLIQKINKWINSIDLPEERIKNSKNIEPIKNYVYQCKNIPAESLAKILNDMIDSIKKIQENANNFNKENRDSFKQTSFLISNKISVTFDKTANSLLINSSEKDYFNLLKVLNKIDKVPEQIFIEVVIAEVNLSDNTEMGVEWQYGTTNQISTSLGLKAWEQLTNPTGKLEGLRYSVLDSKKFNSLIHFMKENSKVKILSTPTITTAHNKKAVIKIGREVPVIKVEQHTNDENNTDDNEGIITQFTEFKDVGITLEVTPRSILGDFVSMDIHLVVSEIDESSQFEGTNNNPVIKKREAETFSTVKSQNTLVIGGLIKKDNTVSDLKVPVLGDIPVLGNLFKRKKKSESKTELRIFIRPVILNKFSVAE